MNLKDSLSDAEVLAYWGFLMDEAKPAFERANGVRSVKFYSGAGELRAFKYLSINNFTLVGSQQ